MLGTVFGEMVDKIDAGSRPRYVWFDFHQECKNMKYENLAKLLQSVDEDFTKHGYFSMNNSNRVLSEQRGVMRSNCLDNLDRTNVVQSLFARRSILAQLGKRSENVLSSPYLEFEKEFKNAWTDHADQLSLLYSGTGALKTDFTRTGKRTMVGAMFDGVNSVQRYFIQNFNDGFLQDGIDLCLSRYKPDLTSKETSAYGAPRVWGPSSEYVVLRVLWVLFALIMALVFILFKQPIGARRALVNKPLLLSNMYEQLPVEDRAVLSPEGFQKASASHGPKHD